MFSDLIFVLICEYLYDQKECIKFLKSFKIPIKLYKFVIEEYTEDNISLLAKLENYLK